MKGGFVWAHLALFIGVLVGAYFFAAKTGVTLLPSQRLNNEFLTCMNTTSLLQADTCVHAHVREWIARYGVAATVNELDTYQTRFGADFTCHLAGHEIGQTLLTLNRGNLLQSLTQCNNACFSSCLHGAIIGYMASNTPAQLLALHPTEYCADPSIQGGYKLCIHGIGHAFMIGEEYDLTKALHDCDQLPRSWVDQDQCYSGIYMELFFASVGLAHGEVASSTYSKSGDIFYPCDVAPTSLNDGYAAECYTQKVSGLVSVAAQQKQSLFTLCAMAPAKWVDTCVLGIGLNKASQTTDASAIAALCDSAPTSAQRDDCLYGAYSYIGSNKDPRGIERFCQTLPKGDQSVCSEKRIPQFGTIGK